MNKGLEELYTLVGQLRATTKKTEKVELLKNAPECTHPWLRYTYDKIKYTYHLTSASLIKDQLVAHKNPPALSFFGHLEYLNEKGSASAEDAADLIHSIDSQWVFLDLFCNVIDRDLKCGINVKTINAAIPGLITEFNVALGVSYKEPPADLYDGNWFVSRKLDGIRCVAIKENGKVRCVSRQGLQFTTTAVLEEELSKLPDSCVLDGELCIVDENGDEDFKAITKEYRRKNHTLQNFRYCVFDCLSLDEFEGRTAGSPFMDRDEDVQAVVEYLTEDCGATHLKAVEQEILDNETQFKEWQAHVQKVGWEGLILRKNTTYKGKRSKDILKVKEFHDEELEILSVEVGPFTVREGGTEHQIDTVTAITVAYKGGEVGVGSGFSLADRDDILKNTENYIGKQATIRYFEECEDEAGKKSLRFPVFKGLRTRGE